MKYFPPKWKPFCLIPSIALLWRAALLAQAPHAYTLSGDFWETHDPSIIKQGDTWYVFATGKAPGGGQLAIRCSNDLEHWRLSGHVFDRIPDWIHVQSPGTVDLWAPDISFFKGVYRLYYAYSLFGRNTSGIALAANQTLDSKSPEYKWIDHGLVLRSTANDNFNAIDPNFIIDVRGRSWLAFGSFWGGIKLRRLDDDGKPSSADTKVYSLATREKPANPPPPKPGLPPDWQAVEAPFIVRHDGFYYLFVSWDLCCRGTKSNYRTMVGRAAEITGPYLDESGKAMIDGGGTQILAANQTWLGPGGESVLLGRPNDHPGNDLPGNDLLVFHAYDAKTGKPALQISTIDWSTGWPRVALGLNHAPER